MHYVPLGGQLLDVVSNNHLSPRQVLRVFYETCSAVAHMHNQIPPIIHRDLKVPQVLSCSIEYITRIYKRHEAAWVNVYLFNSVMRMHASLHCEFQITSYNNTVIVPQYQLEMYHRLPILFNTYFIYCSRGL